MEYVLANWWFWIAGLILFPLIAVLPQLGNIHAAIEDRGKNPEKIQKLFLSPVPLALTIIGGMGVFVCLVLFFSSIVLAMIDHIKG
ncbi:MAG: hypothetical protein GX089_07655 [Fibrobacter sp.]|jgi:hypothetical protein|nr:hypothetical protein [Fibrobacter sp.]HON09297.1 hypothetical protein [Chitinispirillaceae bacterium]